MSASSDSERVRSGVNARWGGLFVLQGGLLTAFHAYNTVWHSSTFLHRVFHLLPLVIAGCLTLTGVWLLLWNVTPRHVRTITVFAVGGGAGFGSLGALFFVHTVIIGGAVAELMHLVFSLATFGTATGTLFGLQRILVFGTLRKSSN